MKTLNRFITFAILAVFTPLTGYAQFEHEHGPDCLGVWCSIDVRLKSDGGGSRTAEYSFPHPPEYLGPMQHNDIGYNRPDYQCYYHIRLVVWLKL